MVRRAAFVLLVVGLAGVGSRPAAADCGGPTYTYDAAPARRGTTVTVTGRGWGDSCYDTGPPPDGEGVLGKPQTNLLVLFVQGGEEVIVGEGDADADYEFVVDVPVPATLTPGEATLAVWNATGSIGLSATDQPIVITDEPPAETVWKVATFGPSRADVRIPSGSASSESEGRDGGLPWLPVGLGAVITVGVIAWGIARRRPTE
jgi:hypothetical protein